MTARVSDPVFMAERIAARHHYSETAGTVAAVLFAAALTAGWAACAVYGLLTLTGAI